MGGRLVLRYLQFEQSEGDEGVVTFDAMASTDAARHGEVMAEVQQVLDWARLHFPATEGPVEDGMDWHPALQVQSEAGGWHTVSLTIAASPAFAGELLAAVAGEGETSGH